MLKVPTPDFTGRLEILTLYLNKIRSKAIDAEILARGTTGFTGADLENMVNQAALRAAIDGADSVTMKYLENARDKVLMGKYVQLSSLLFYIKSTLKVTHTFFRFFSVRDIKRLQ